MGWLGVGCGSWVPEPREGRPSAPPEVVDRAGSDPEPVREEPGTSEDADAGPLPEPPPPEEGPGCEALAPIIPEVTSAGTMSQVLGDRYLNFGDVAADGSGAVVVSWTHYGYSPISIAGWSQTGTLATTFRADTFEPQGQPHGFLSFSLMPEFPYLYDYRLSFLDSRTWAFTHHPFEESSPTAVANVPSGGLRVRFKDGTFKAYGPTGQSLWSMRVPFNGVLNAWGVDAEGHTLFVSVGEPTDGTATRPVYGLWVDASGQPGRLFHVMDQPSGWSIIGSMVQHAERGLFLGMGNATTTVWSALAPMETHAKPAPTWLARTAAQPLTRLPNGKGYIRWTSVPGCRHEAEFFALSGRSCGTTRFPAPPFELTGRCRSTMRMGADGTVAEVLVSEFMQQPPDDETTKFLQIRWWPAVLRPWSQSAEP